MTWAKIVCFFLGHIWVWNSNAILVALQLSPEEDGGCLCCRRCSKRVWHVILQ